MWACAFIYVNVQNTSVQCAIRKPTHPGGPRNSPKIKQQSQLSKAIEYKLALRRMHTEEDFCCGVGFSLHARSTRFRAQRHHGPTPARFTTPTSALALPIPTPTPPKPPCQKRAPWIRSSRPLHPTRDPTDDQQIRSFRTTALQK